MQTVDPGQPHLDLDRYVPRRQEVRCYHSSGAWTCGEMPVLSEQRLWLHRCGLCCPHKFPKFRASGTQNVRKKHQVRPSGGHVFVRTQFPGVQGICRGPVADHSRTSPGYSISVQRDVEGTHSLTRCRHVMQKEQWESKDSFPHLNTDYTSTPLQTREKKEKVQQSDSREEVSSIQLNLQLLCSFAKETNSQITRG